MYIKSSCCTPQIDTMLYIHYISIKLRGKATLAGWSIMTCKGDQVLGNAGATSLKPNDLLNFLHSVFKFQLPALSAASTCQMGI